MESISYRIDSDPSPFEVNPARLVEARSLALHRLGWHRLAGLGTSPNLVELTSKGGGFGHNQLSN